MHTNRGIPSTRAAPHRQEMSLEMQTGQTVRVWYAPKLGEILSPGPWGALERDCAGYLRGICQVLRELGSGVRESHEGWPWWWSVSTWAQTETPRGVYGGGEDQREH